MNQAEGEPQNQNKGTAVNNTGAEANAPILIDLGKKKRRTIKKLRQGRGSLIEAIDEAVAELEVHNQIASAPQRVVVVVREKKKSRRGWGW